MSECNPDKQEKVLIVDDDMANRLMIREALEQRGYTIFEAEDGVQGLEVFAADKPDLILSDVMMPNMDGFEFCREIRKHNYGSFIPVLIMTALEDYDSINQAYDAGATDFITKPVNYLLLSYRLQYMLRTKYTADQLRTSQSRLVNAQRIARLGHWELDISTGLMEVSSELNNIFGLTDVESLSDIEKFVRYLAAGDRQSFLSSFNKARETRTGFIKEYKVVRPDKSQVQIELFAEYQGSHINGKEILTGAIQDITERKRVEQQINHLSWYNKLTGLPNRHLLLRNLGKMVATAKKRSTNFAVMSLNLDHFERINNSLGYSAGDELIINVKQRLLDCLADLDISIHGNMKRAVANRDYGDVLAHLGGDDFVVLLHEINSAEDVAVIARRIAEILCKPVKISNSEISITASVGISIFPNDGENEEVLMKNASAALHDAKDSGRNCYKFYTREMNARTFEKLSLEASLRRAIDEQQLLLYYQPKIRTKDYGISGAEALIRWLHPDLGLVSPTDFIPIAESSGLIVQIGEWVIEESCRQLSEWKKQGITLDSLSINVSTSHLNDDNLLNVLQYTITKYDIEPSSYDLEVTESVLMNNIDSVLPIMNHLRSLGIDLSIDDFGTGYSSLAYLKQLPITTLKIDQSFIRDVHINHDDAVIVDAIIAMSKSMGLKVIAEGVELKEHVSFLKERECDYLQGYYFSQPLPAGEFKDWVLAEEARKKSVVNA